MTDYETIQKRRNITVGIFVILAICALLWLIHKFEDMPIQVGALRSYRIFIQFPSAGGVQERTPVKFCGVQIGRVVEVKPPAILQNKITGQYYHQAVVVIDIDSKFDEIPINVEAKLMTRGLGSSYIDLRAKPFDPQKPTEEFLVQGSELQGSAGITSEFFPEESQKKIENLVSSLDSLIKNTNDILGDQENKQNIKKSLDNLSEASQKAAAAADEMKNFMTSGIQTSEKLHDATDQLRIVLEKLNSGQGTASKLLNDGRLYESLIDTSEQLQLLLAQLDSFVEQSKEKGLPIKVK